MGAGARLAEERDKWTDDWQIADLEPEGEHLIALLELAEELRAVVPGVREGSSGRAPVLIGVTDRRILVVGRWPVADVDQPLRDDPPREVPTITTAITASLEEARDGRGTHLGLPGAEFRLDPVALHRLWEHVAGWQGASGAAERRTQLRRSRSSAVTAAPSA
jgi:hypothetical protein